MNKMKMNLQLFAADAKPNVLTYSKIFQPALDKQVVQESTTGWMELNSNLIKYEGGDEVRLPNMIMDGLADYDRTKGYVSGAVTLKWDTYKLTQDRGRSFSIDAMDVDETNFVVTASTVMSEFQRTRVIPEIDAYRYSKLASLAIEAGQSTELAVTNDNVVEALIADLIELEDSIGLKDVIITLSPIIAGKIAAGGKDLLSKAALKQGAISLDVQTFNDNIMVRVPSKLLNTEIEIKDGTTVGQEEGGWEVADGSKKINWIIAAKDAPIAVSKTDLVRTFSPLENQDANAWKTDYRKYHDLWVPKSKLKSIFVNTEV